MISCPVSIAYVLQKRLRVSANRKPAFCENESPQFAKSLAIFVGMCSLCALCPPLFSTIYSVWHTCTMQSKQYMCRSQVIVAVPIHGGS